MSFINGFLSLCTAVAPGTVTEAVGVPRQPVSFNTPRSGVSMLAAPVTFGFNTADVGFLAGRAIFDAPAGGRLLLVAPMTSPRPWGSQPQALDVAQLRFAFDALLGWPDAEAYSGSLAAGMACGVCYEVPGDVWGTTTSQTGLISHVTTAPMTAGVALTIARGVLSAT